MFRHIVMYKLKDKNDAKTMCEKFKTLPQNISEVVSLEAGTDIQNSDASFDVVLNVTFKSREDYLKYNDHPYHVNEVMSYVHSVIAQRYSVDFEI